MTVAMKIKEFPDKIYLDRGLREKWISIQEISMAAIVVDTAFQARVTTIDMNHVRTLAKARDVLIDSGGGKFLHPITVFLKPDGTFLLADGFHRHKENLVRRGESILAYVVEAEDWEHEARLFSAMCNRELCLPRSKEDIRKAVEILLDDPECWRWADLRIGLHCGVGSETVKRSRLSNSVTTGRELPEYVLGRNNEPRRYERDPSGPRLNSRTRNGNPRQSYFSTSVDGKQVCLGTDIDSASKKFDAIKRNSEERAKNLPASGNLSHYFTCKNLLFSSISMHPKSGPHVTGVYGHNTVVVVSRFGERDSVPWILGCLQILRLRSPNQSARMVCLCYPSDGPQEAMDLARKFGVEFLSPDELIESIKEAAQKGQP